MKRAVVAAAVVALLAGALWSYWSDGVVHVLVSGASDGHALERLRAILRGWGPLAPVVYTLAVVVEVIVAPIPGALLYAPAGALFGGFLGGTLSLIGNTIGAAICGAIGGALGEQGVARRIGDGPIGRYREALQARGLWMILLLRANPLTSSDLVSYAAGMLAVPVWKVALGTFIGMAPLCYAQSYFAEQLFERLPGAFTIVVGACLLVLAALVLWLGKQRQKRTTPGVGDAAS